MTSICVCIFVKPPQKGKVKTRLAASIGDDAALAAYIELVEHQLEAIAPLCAESAELQMWFAQEPNELALRWADSLQAKVFVQQGEDLGERMHDAFARNDGDQPTIVIGSDCPTMSASVIRHAAQQLESHDVVFNPAEDGGYVLVGANRAHSALFEGIAWSTERVLAQSLQAAERAGLKVALGPTLWDVDEAGDLERWKGGEGKT